MEAKAGPASCLRRYRFTVGPDKTVQQVEDENGPWVEFGQADFAARGHQMLKEEMPRLLDKLAATVAERDRLTEERDHLQIALDIMNEQSPVQECELLRAERDRLREVLAGLEWASTDYDYDERPSMCPMCRHTEPTHSATCALAAALRTTP